jgi:hypothetical protein
MEVGCGYCLGCRLDKSKELATRCVHEAQMHQDNCFVTLTYDSENLPTDGSLSKLHFPAFMKRLRKKYDDREIRYLYCGEYGDETFRPHYHACLFGIDFEDAIEDHVNDRDDVLWHSDELDKIWGKGFCTIGELNWDTAAYTSRYIMKKVVGQRAEEHYWRDNPLTGESYKLEPEFCKWSLGRKKGDGLGGRFFKKYQSDFFPRDECPIPGKGVYNSIPRYYEKIYAEENPDAFAEIKKRRRKFRDTHSHDYTTKRLEDRFHVKKAAISNLKRKL